ncbi:MAG: DUF3857 domain-containing protein [Acidobacteria bacterium]|nr:DUF3857 domain-containing protein [Acidobacteriota bacterium]
MSRFLVALCMAGTSVLVAGPGMASGGSRSGWSPEPVVAPVAEVLAAARRNAPPEGADVQVFLREQRVSLDEHGRELRTWTLVYRLLTRTGVEEWGSTEQLWEPWHQERPVPRVRVILPSGSVHELDPATITDSPAADGAARVYDDRRVLRGPIPAMVPGAIVEESWRVKESVPKYPGGAVHFFYPGTSLPLAEGRLIVELPEKMPFHYVVEKLDGVEPEETRAAGRRRIVFRMVGLKAMKDPPAGLPPDVPREPRIGFSTAASWQAVACGYHEMIAERIDGTGLDALVARVRQAVAEGADPAEAAVALVRTTVRYTGLEFGEAQLVPYEPKKVVSRGYGDCKDKATLTVALLRRLGIPATMALLQSGFGRDIDPALPGLGVFDHAIVHVGGEPERWLDPTETFGPVSCLPLADRGRLALIVDPSTTGLVRTPAPTSGDALTIHERTIRLATFGDATLELKIHGECLRDAWLRSYYAGRSRDDLKEGLEDWASGELLAKSIDDLRYPDPEDQDVPFVIEATMKSGRGLTTFSEAAAAIRYESLLDTLPSAVTDPPKDEADREGRDFVFWQPYSREWRYTIVPPLGFVLYHVPEDRTTKVGAGRLVESYEAGDDGVVRASLRFDSGPRRITAKQLEATRKAVKEIQEWPPAMVLYHHAGMRALAEGHVQEALKLLRADAEAEPSEGIHLARLARGLLAAGFGARAKVTARKAVELAPESAEVRATLGWCLEHDDIGRRFGAGWDRAAAVTAYEETVALPGASTENKLDLAILLEFGEDGTRYTTGKKDEDRAIALFKEVLKDGDDPAIDHTLALAQLHAGHLDELVQRKGELGTSWKIDGVVAAAVAIEDGAGAASRLIAGRGGTGEERSRVYQGAAFLLLQMRRYPEAAELMRRSAQGAADATSVLASASSIGSARPYEELDIKPTTPEGLAKAMTIAVVCDPSGKALRKILSSFLEALIEDEERDGILLEDQIRGPMQRASKRTSLPLKVLVDLGFTVLDAKVTGKEGPVRRVRLISATGENRSETTIWAIRQGREWRVLAIEGVLGPLGEAALDELDRGHPRGAYEILDWARKQTRLWDSPDPFDGSPFARCWKENGEGDSATARLAAAMLIAGTAHPDRGVKILKERLAKGIEGPMEAWARIALAQGLETQEKHGRALELWSRLLEQHPESDRLFFGRTSVLASLSRWDEIRAAVSDRLERFHDERTVVRCQRLLASVAMRTGRFEDAEKWLAMLTESEKALPSDFNNRAWLALVRGKPGREALDWAFRASKLSGGGHGVLHTVACLLAAMDRPADAYQVIVQAIASSPRREPQDVDWFVFGRMAETYGFLDIARESYGKVKRPEGESLLPTSTYALAQRRIRALRAAANTAGSPAPAARATP